MDDLTNLLQSNASTASRFMPIIFPLVIAIGCSFVVYLARCYWAEWRIHKRVQRRVARSRAVNSVNVSPTSQIAVAVAHCEESDHGHAQAA